MRLTNEQIERYGRQMVIKGIGKVGQKKLLRGRVLVIGAGGLGSSAGLYLAAAGVGTIGIVDSDKVELSNLNRQVLHGSNDLGRQKVLSAAATLRKVNPDVNVHTYNTRATAENIGEMIREYDFVVDATDNFAGKFLINDACYFERVPLSHASALGMDGQIMTVLPGESACYRCVLPEPPAEGTVPCSAEAGILGAVPGVIGTLQASEAIKFILGTGELLVNRMLIYEGLTGIFREVGIERNGQCPLCGVNPSITELFDEQ